MIYNSFHFNFQSKVKKPGEEEEEEKIEPASFSRVIELNKSEWPYLVSGGFFAALVGIFPVAFAVILSELISVSNNVFFVR